MMIAAPASAGSIDCAAICSGVTGSASDMVGGVREPVTAQLMITFANSILHLDARQDLRQHVFARRRSRKIPRPWSRSCRGRPP